MEMNLPEIALWFQRVSQEELKKDARFRLVTSIKIIQRKSPDGFTFRIPNPDRFADLKIERLTPSGTFAMVKKIVEEIDTSGCIAKFKIRCDCEPQLCVVEHVMRM